MALAWPVNQHLSCTLKYFSMKILHPYRAERQTAKHHAVYGQTCTGYPVRYLMTD